MDARSLTMMILAVVVGVGLLLLLNMMTLFQKDTTGHYLSRVEIRGIALIQKNKKIALSYDQQNDIIHMLNNATPIDKAMFPDAGTPTNIEKIIVYRFDQPEIEITPIKYAGNKFIFQQAQWNPKGWLTDTSNGLLKAKLAEILNENDKENTTAAAPPATEKPFLITDDVNSITLLSFDKKEQKLNAANTASVISYINTSKPIDKIPVLEKGKKSEVDKIYITRKNDNPVEITIVAYLENSVVFYESHWSPNGLLMDNSDGAFKTLLSQYF